MWEGIRGETNRVVGILEQYIMRKFVIYYVAIKIPKEVRFPLGSRIPRVDIKVIAQIRS